jgi:hypothetical protein
MKRKKKEEIYELTLKGLLSMSIDDDKLLNSVLDDLELYMRRHYSKGGHPAIVYDLDENKFSFVTIQKQ